MSTPPDKLGKIVRSISSLGESERRRVLVELADVLSNDPALNGERDLYRRIRQLVWQKTHRVAPGVDEDKEITESLRVARDLAEKTESGRDDELRSELRDPIQAFKELRFSDETVRRLQDILSHDRQ